MKNTEKERKRKYDEQIKNEVENSGGFTLIEMLIVVAIIAILIAISIPIINNALEKARDATDDANFRDAAAMGNIKLLTEDLSEEKTYWYCTNTSAQGNLLESPTTEYTIYTSQCRAESGTTHGKTKTSSDKNIKVIIKPADSSVTVTWEKKS